MTLVAGQGVEFFTNTVASGAPFGRILEGELKFSVDDAQVPARIFAVQSGVAVDCP